MGALDTLNEQLQLNSVCIIDPSPCAGAHLTSLLPTRTALAGDAHGLLEEMHSKVRPAAVVPHGAQAGYGGPPGRLGSAASGNVVPHAQIGDPWVRFYLLGILALIDTDGL